MGSHLYLEHKTFLGGKLPSCVSACSAALKIQHHHCQYCCCDTENNKNIELPTGLNSVTLSCANLCPHRYMMFERDSMVKHMHL